MYLERENTLLMTSMCSFIDISKVLHGLIFKGEEIIFRTTGQGQHLSYQKDQQSKREPVLALTQDSLDSALLVQDRAGMELPCMS